nr:GNAT family N-acetyltransferase [Rhodovibrio sodomensis]
MICFPAGGASPDAEAAFTVEPAWQGLGHGRALMEAALRDAARREVAQIVLHIQPQNLPMRRIAERHSFRIMLDSGEILATRQVIPDDQPLAA